MRCYNIEYNEITEPENTGSEKTTIQQDIAQYTLDQYELRYLCAGEYPHLWEGPEDLEGSLLELTRGRKEWKGGDKCVEDGKEGGKEWKGGEEGKGEWKDE